MRSPFASWMERFAIESPESIADTETDQDPMMAYWLPRKILMSTIDYRKYMASKLLLS